MTKDAHEELLGLLEEIATEVTKDAAPGTPARYIPALAAADPSAFGFALAHIDGRVYGTGDWQVPFSIQSISKVFSLALVLAHRGEAIWNRVGREPSGRAFNSLAQLEYEHGIPRNPFINAGALVVTDELLKFTDNPSMFILDFLREETGNLDLTIDGEVAESEAQHSNRNAALAHLMADFGNLTHAVPRVLWHYIRQCAIKMSCRDLVLAGNFLARHGLRADGSRLLSRTDAKRIGAMMLSCGTYDAAGEFAYRVGLPGKSGVSGGILAVVPGRYTLCVWSPGLDRHGNSVAAVAALDRFTTTTGCSVF